MMLVLLTTSEMVQTEQPLAQEGQETTNSEEVWQRWKTGNLIQLVFKRVFLEKRGWKELCWDFGRIASPRISLSYLYFRRTMESAENELGLAHQAIKMTPKERLTRHRLSGKQTQ